MRVTTPILLMAAACGIVGSIALVALPLSRAAVVVGALWLILVLVTLRYRWR